MIDRIIVKNLLVRGILGIKPDERVKRQDILINLELRTDLRRAAVDDTLEEGLNYRTVTKQVIALVEGSQFHTVEKLATEIAQIVVTHHAAESVTVRVEKPGALRFAESVGVEITRSRADFEA